MHLQEDGWLEKTDFLIMQIHFGLQGEPVSSLPERLFPEPYNFPPFTLKVGLGFRKGSFPSLLPALSSEPHWASGSSIWSSKEAADRMAAGAGAPPLGCDGTMLDFSILNEKYMQLAVR